MDENLSEGAGMMRDIFIAIRHLRMSIRRPGLSAEGTAVQGHDSGTQSGTEQRCREFEECHYGPAQVVPGMCPSSAAGAD